MSDTIEPLLSRAEAALVELQTNRDEAPSLAREFGLHIGDIGRALTLHPEHADKVRAFVERTAPIVQRDTGLVFWIHRVYDAAESRSSETYEYIGALSLRSSLEFFRDLYRESVARPRVEEIELDDTDENLKEWGAEQYLEEIPPGFPDSHRWWHQSLSGK